MEIINGAVQLGREHTLGIPEHHAHFICTTVTRKRPTNNITEAMLVVGSRESDKLIPVESVMGIHTTGKRRYYVMYLCLLGRAQSAPFVIMVMISP